MKRKILNTLLIVHSILALFCGHCMAQQEKEISVYAGFLQMKDELNQDMVYNGLQTGFHYQQNWFFKDWKLLYKPKISLGIPFNRGMMGVNINFVPVDFSSIKIVYDESNHKLGLGVNFVTNYSYQAYPEQHSAKLFWYGEIGIAPCVEYSYQWNQRKINVFLQNSVAGFVSRKESVSPYFYSFKFSDFFVGPHEKMQFGSFDKYNHTHLSVQYIPDLYRNHSFAFEVENIACYFSTHFQSLNYYLQWKKSF